METAQIADFFYQGKWRLDCGLGNPNKTAALLAQFALLSLYFIKYGKWGNFLSGVLFSASVICLFHTFSRGGICALLAGGGIFLFFTFRKTSAKEWICKILIIIGLVIYCFLLGAQTRYVQGIRSEDESITNRLQIWSNVPEMIVDAPYGWGAGESGKVYMRWYQPAESNEQYRTLVNSHFTWLVEFGWPGRIFYVVLWIFVLSICLPYGNSRFSPIPLAVIISFAVSSFFSSVAESWILWIIPCFCICWAAFFRIQKKIPLNKVFLIMTSMFSCLILCSIVWYYSGSHIKKQKAYVRIGGEAIPSIWIISDSSIFGDRACALSLRNLLNNSNSLGSEDISIGICDSLSDIPVGYPCKTLIMSGNIFIKESSLIKEIKSETIMIFSPQFAPPDLSLMINNQTRLLVFIGEFSNSEYLLLWDGIPNCTQIKGIGDYIPDLGEFLKSQLPQNKQ